MTAPDCLAELTVDLLNGVPAGEAGELAARLMLRLVVGLREIDAGTYKAGEQGARH